MLQGRPEAASEHPSKSCGSSLERPISSKAAPPAQCCHSFELQPSWPPKLTAIPEAADGHPLQSYKPWSWLEAF